MANESIKVLQTGAVELESGDNTDQSPGWGESGSEETLGANDGFPWLNFTKGKTIDTVEDNSVTSVAFQDTPRQVTQYVERGIGYHPRFVNASGVNAMGKLNYWMFGFENTVKEVTVFTLSVPSVEPVAGAVYRDTDLNDFTFMRKETDNGGTIRYVFEADDSTAPTLQSGDLDQVSGTGDDPLTFSAHSGVMYEHLYELDAHERHLTSYRTAEQITGWTSGFLKNRMATLGIAMGLNDFRYKNAMCKKFGFVSAAGGLAEMNSEFLAYTEDRGDYSSSSWTYPTSLIDSDNIIAHHQLMFEVGTAEGSLTALGITNVNLDCTIPLQVIQDTTSGLYISEPVMEGKYECELAATLSRYSADTYQDLTDAWTSVVVRLAANYGWYMTEFLVQEAKIAESGPDDDDVAKENLAFRPGYTTSNNWSTWLSGNSLIQNSPILMRVRDADSQNYMFHN